MSYQVQYISCKVCGTDKPDFLGIRGNLEYNGAPPLRLDEEHIVTNVVRCRRCRFVYTNPLILGANRARYTDPEGYNPSASAADTEKLFNYIMGLIEKHAPDKGRLLDVGCGKGEFLSLAKKRGWDVYGTEPSREMAKYAEETYNLRVKSDMENIPLGNASFDVVTLNMVLEHLDAPRGTLLKINNILKNRGLLFIEVPNTDSWMLTLAALYFRLNKKEWSPLLSPLHHPYHSYGYNISSVGYLLKNTGFRVKEAIVTDTRMRGMRFQSSAKRLETRLCTMAGRITGFIGKGDVLIVIAMKE